MLPILVAAMLLGCMPVTAETVCTATGSMTLTALWTANTYTVTLDAGKGTVEPDEIAVTFGEVIGELPVPTREGFEFCGWKDAQGNAVTDATVYTVAGNVTLTASWIEVESSSSDTGDATP